MHDMEEMLIFSSVYLDELVMPYPVYLVVTMHEVCIF